MGINATTRKDLGILRTSFTSSSSKAPSQQLPNPTSGDRVPGITDHDQGDDNNEDDRQDDDLQLWDGLQARRPTVLLLGAPIH